MELLQTGATWKAMPNVVGAIRNLCQNSASNKDAVREAGGIKGLVELLKAGHESPAAVKAAETLEVVLEQNAANERATVAAILDNGAVAAELLAGFSQLRERLQKAAERVLMTAAERNDSTIFERAMREASSLALSQSLLDSAQRRAQAVREQSEREAARRARRESLGLGQLSTPNEFLCPITQDVMIDPVVASDGHSYERSAIQAIIDRSALDGGQQALSPLTREQLEPTLVPNINLRKRIREHDNEVESVAQQVLNSVHSKHSADAAAAAAAAAVGLAADDGSAGGVGGGSSSASLVKLEASAAATLAGSALVASKLTELNLQRYASGFDDNGYDSWDELLAMSDVQIEKLVATVGIVSNHADRLRNALAREAAADGARAAHGGSTGAGVGTGAGTKMSGRGGSGSARAHVETELTTGTAASGIGSEAPRNMALALASDGSRRRAGSGAANPVAAGEAGTTGGGSRRSSPDAGAEQLVPPPGEGGALAAAGGGGGRAARKRESSGADGTAAPAAPAAQGGRKVRRVGERSAR